ncbi:MAG: DUF3047 domain-containing protein [Deltaproteobacteria bacterium]|nr:DUF3047 domain-containing protein [Deltaproteobacteria bacterium]
MMGILLLLLFLLSWPAEGGAQIVVDRFSKTDAQGLPAGWTLEGDRGESSKISVEQADSRTFLRLVSIRNSFGLKKELRFDIRRYPYLSWFWKADQLPKGGDIRKRETDDQAGQLYVLFPRFPARINTRSVGYIWDTLAPAGLAGTSTAYGKMKYFVLQSGPASLGRWMAETRNVYRDYKTLFREEPPEVGGVLLYINTQHTGSQADFSYDDLVFSASPPKEGEGGRGVGRRVP